ncbi:hypothetical protein D918_01778, partial [Trichuris suis]
LCAFANKHFLCFKERSERWAPRRFQRPPATAGFVSSHSSDYLSATGSSSTEDLGAAPYFESELRNAQCFAGEAVRFACKVAGEVDSIVWKKDGQIMQNGEDFVQTYDAQSGWSTMRIVESFTEDTGVISCHATNRHGEAVTSCFLTVNDSSSHAEPAVELAAEVSVTESEDYSFSGQTLRWVTALENATLRDGEEMKLIVEVEGYPSKGFCWSLDDKPLERDDRFKIVTDGSVSTLFAKRPIAGVYQVTAANQWSQCASTCSIDVTKGEPAVKKMHKEECHLPAVDMADMVPPKITKHIQSLTVAPNTPLELYIEYISKTPAHVEWFSENERIPVCNQRNGLNNSSVYVSSPISGCYCAKVKNDHGTSTSVAFIKVKEESELPHFEETMTVSSISESFIFSETLEFEGTQAPPMAAVEYDEVISKRPKVEWKPAAEAVSTSSYESADVAKLEIVEEELLLPSKEERLEKFAPVFVEKLAPLSVQPRQPVEMGVKVESRPDSSLQWFLEGILVERGPEIDIQTDRNASTIRFSSDIPKQYTVVVKAENEVGIAVDSAIVSFDLPKKAPSILTQPKTINIRRGEYIDLTMQVDGYPPPKLTWRINGTPVDVSEKVRVYETESQARLVFSTSSIPAKEIELLAENEVGTAVARINVHLLDWERPEEMEVPKAPQLVRRVPPEGGMAPVIVVPLRDTVGNVEDRIKLSCQVVCDVDYETYWYVGQRLLSSDSNIQMLSETDGTQTLIIEKLSKNYTGTYMCYVRNRWGAASTKANVQFAPVSEVRTAVVAAEESLQITVQQQQTSITGVQKRDVIVSGEQLLEKVEDITQLKVEPPLPAYTELFEVVQRQMPLFEIVAIVEDTAFVAEEASFTLPEIPMPEISTALSIAMSPEVYAAETSVKQRAPTWSVSYPSISIRREDLVYAEVEEKVSIEKKTSEETVGIREDMISPRRQATVCILPSADQLSIRSTLQETYGVRLTVCELVNVNIRVTEDEVYLKAMTETLDAQFHMVRQPRESVSKTMPAHSRSVCAVHLRKTALAWTVSELVSQMSYAKEEIETVTVESLAYYDHVGPEVCCTMTVDMFKPPVVETCVAWIVVPTLPTLRYYVQIVEKEEEQEYVRIVEITDKLPAEEKRPTRLVEQVVPMVTEAKYPPEINALISITKEEEAFEQILKIYISQLESLDFRKLQTEQCLTVEEEWETEEVQLWITPRRAAVRHLELIEREEKEMVAFEQKAMQMEWDISLLMFRPEQQMLYDVHLHAPLTAVVTATITRQMPPAVHVVHSTEQVLQEVDVCSLLEVSQTDILQVVQVEQCLDTFVYFYKVGNSREVDGRLLCFDVCAVSATFDLTTQQGQVLRIALESKRLQKVSAVEEILTHQIEEVFIEGDVLLRNVQSAFDLTAHILAESLENAVCTYTISEGTLCEQKMRTEQAASLQLLIASTEWAEQKLKLIELRSIPEEKRETTEMILEMRKSTAEVLVNVHVKRQPAGFHCKLTTFYADYASTRFRMDVIRRPFAQVESYPVTADYRMEMCSSDVSGMVLFSKVEQTEREIVESEFSRTLSYGKVFEAERKEASLYDVSPGDKLTCTVSVEELKPVCTLQYPSEHRAESATFESGVTSQMISAFGQTFEEAGEIVLQKEESKCFISAKQAYTDSSYDSLAESFVSYSDTAAQEVDQLLGIFGVADYAMQQRGLLLTSSSTSDYISQTADFLSHSSTIPEQERVWLHLELEAPQDKAEIECVLIRPQPTDRVDGVISESLLLSLSETIASVSTVYEGRSKPEELDCSAFLSLVEQASTCFAEAFAQPVLTKLESHWDIDALFEASCQSALTERKVSMVAFMKI